MVDSPPPPNPAATTLDTHVPSPHQTMRLARRANRVIDRPDPLPRSSWTVRVPSSHQAVVSRISTRAPRGRGLRGACHNRRSPAVPALYGTRKRPPPFTELEGHAARFHATCPSLNHLLPGPIASRSQSWLTASYSSTRNGCMTPGPPSGSHGTRAAQSRIAALAPPAPDRRPGAGVCLPDRQGPTVGCRRMAAGLTTRTAARSG